MTRPVVMTVCVAKSRFQECVAQGRWKPGHYMVKSYHTTDRCYLCLERSGDELETAASEGPTTISQR